MAQHDEHSIAALLDGLEKTAKSDCVSVSDILDEFGDRAITPFILIAALILITPISGIPTVPTFAAIVMVLLAGQALIGRQRLWLPDFVRRQEIKGEKLRRGVSWLRKPAAFVDRHSRRRLRVLTKGPARVLNLLIITVIPIGWPPLELLPMVTSIGAGTVALLAFGLFVRDGLYVLLGYVAVAATAGTGVYFLL